MALPVCSRTETILLQLTAVLQRRLFSGNFEYELVRYAWFLQLLFSVASWISNPNHSYFANFAFTSSRLFIYEPLHTVATPAPQPCTLTFRQVQRVKFVSSKWLLEVPSGSKVPCEFWSELHQNFFNLESQWTYLSVYTRLISQMAKFFRFEFYENLRTFTARVF